MELEVSKNVSLREVFEAKNLARVMEYVCNRPAKDLSKETILLLHKMLLTNIKDDISGRFRGENEYVRIGAFIAAPPEHVEGIISEITTEYSSDQETYFIDNIAKFHLAFETLHPFVDGNGRIGRVLINQQLYLFGFPSLIIRDKGKKYYYKAFKAYQDSKDAKIMENIVGKALIESLHKRIAYLKGAKIIELSQYAAQTDKSFRGLLNAAKRQTIGAFRENGVWKIAL